MRHHIKRLVLLLSILALLVISASCFFGQETDSTDPTTVTSSSATSSVPATKDLTVNDVIRLSSKGKALSWKDFEDYRCSETGSGLYIRVYKLDQGYTLSIGGGNTDSDPMYITLTDPSGRYIDVRDGNVSDFVNGKPSETSASSESTSASSSASSAAIDENGTFTHKDDVALYIHTYGHLPSNFITKKKAKELGWSSGGLDDYLYGGCIGGDKFGNYEDKLPEANGRRYYECDIDTMHKKSRGSKRIVYSSDGLIYYTEDHYSTFELLYGSEV